MAAEPGPVAAWSGDDVTWLSLASPPRPRVAPRPRWLRGLTAADSQPPLWDGDGIDPWLPDRLAADAELAAQERQMYNSWWGSFSDFLVKAHRGVLAGGGMPDPHGVFAAVPLWAEAMAAFVAGPVKATVGLAFEKLFGAGFEFDQRPKVTTYLATVQNRMVRTPDDVFGRVAAEVARGAAAGDSIPKVAARIDQLLGSTNAVENWSGRAVTVARTETIGALNFGRHDAFAEMADQLGQPMQQQWLATIDARTRLDHVEADGQRVPVGQPFLVGGEPLMFPGDPGGSAGNVINCRCTTLLVAPGEVLDVSDRGWAADDEQGTWSPPGQESPAEMPLTGQAQYFHTSLRGLEDLARAVTAAPPEFVKVLGANSGMTDLVRLSDGRLAVRKTTMTTTPQDAEQAGSIVARQLGLAAPRVYREADTEIFMDYLESPTAAELEADARETGDINAWSAWLDRKARLQQTDDGVVMGLLDQLVNNVDRNIGNWIVAAGDRIQPIDHGQAYTLFQRHRQATRAQTVGPTRTSPFSDAFQENGRWVDNPLTQEDIVVLRTRLESLRPQFEQMERDSWLDWSLGVVDQLEPHAKGTRNLIAGRSPL